MSEEEAGMAELLFKDLAEGAAFVLAVDADTHGRPRQVYMKRAPLAGANAVAFSPEDFPQRLRPSTTYVSSGVRVHLFGGAVQPKKKEGKTMEVSVVDERSRSAVFSGLDMWQFCYRVEDRENSPWLPGELWMKVGAAAALRVQHGTSHDVGPDTEVVPVKKIKITVLE